MKISKITYAVLSAVVLSTAIVSCNDDEKNVDNPHNPDEYVEENSSEISNALIAKKSLSDYVSWPDNYFKFVDKVDKFSSKLATTIGCESDGNTAISPLSVFMALSMAAEGANNDTRQEILDALGLSYQELTENIKYLVNSTNRLFGHDNRKNQIKCVNSLWLKDGYDVNKDGVNSLTHNFYSDVFKMDFSNSDINSLVTSYIKNETFGFLNPNLQISDDAMILLINVVYLREVWSQLGDLEFTSSTYNFLNYDKSKKKTKLLQGDYCAGRAIDKDKYKKFYTSSNSGLNLTFYVPKDGYSVDDIYTSDVLNDETRYLYSDQQNDYYTRCFFPEFKAEFDDDIINILKKLGVKKLFNSDCDFSNLTNQSVYCKKVKHIAKLDVCRSGVEGAAVTEMEFPVGAAGPDEVERHDVYEDFIVDRNFVYVLSDSNGVPLFAGVVKKID